MMMQFAPRTAAGMTAACLLLTSLAVRAEPSRFEEQIKYRRAAMTMLKWHMDKISPLVKSPQTLNREDVLNNAMVVETLSKVAFEAYVPGSYEGETKAKAEIGKDWSRFKGMADKFAAEAAKLRELAKSGNAAAIKAQLNETTKVCKNCHDDFKSSSLF